MARQGRTNGAEIEHQTTARFRRLAHAGRFAGWETPEQIRDLFAYLRSKPNKGS